MTHVHISTFPIAEQSHFASSLPPQSWITHETFRRQECQGLCLPSSNACTMPAHRPIQALISSTAGLILPPTVRRRWGRCSRQHRGVNASTRPADSTTKALIPRAASFMFPAAVRGRWGWRRGGETCAADTMRAVQALVDSTAGLILPATVC